MKNLFKLFVPVAAAAIALVSCQPKEEQVGNNPAGEVTIRVHAAADNLKAGDQETKTYIDNYQGTANTILWGTGEYMKLALTAGDKTTFATSTDASADIFNGDPEAMFEFSVTPETASEYVYQGLYPASAAATSDNTKADNYKVNLPAIQNATAFSYDPAAYIMVAKPESFASVQTDWEASFRRGTALNKITLKNFASSVSINKVKITADGKKLAGGRHFNLTTGVGLEVYGTDATIEVLYATPLTGTSMDVWFTSWDVEIEEGETLTIVAYTTDNKSYTKSITVPAGKSIKFLEGYLNTLGASLEGITAQNVSTFADGTYLVLARKGSAEPYTYYAMKGEANGTRVAYEDYSGSLSSYNGDEALVWTITASGNSYTFENRGNYLGWSSGNAADLVASADYDAAKCLMSIDDNGNGTFKVTNTNTPARYLAKNTSSAWFAFYENSGQYGDIVFVPATAMAKVATPTFDPAAGAVSSGTNVSISCATSGATIHYTVDGTDPTSSSATYSSPIEITATTTIKAIAVKSGMADSEINSATYTIQGAGSDWELVSDFSTIDDGGEYIFVNVQNSTSYYMNTATCNQGAGTGCVALTILPTESGFVASDNMILVLSGSANGFVASNKEGKQLKIGATNNGLAMNADSGTSLTFYTDANVSGYTLKGNDTNNVTRYIGMNSTTNFRCYNSVNTNVKTGEYVWYHHIGTGSNVTWNLESISITTPPTKTVYTAGQSFDPAGMVVTGHFVDADDATNTKDEAVTGYTITPDGALAVSDTQVTITYQGKTATQNITVNAAPAGNDGSLEHPYTVSEVRAYMDASESNRGPVYISGIVSSVYAAFDQSHGTGIFYISDDGETTSDQFEAYSVKFLGNNAWVNGNTQIAVGNTVIVYGGELTIYNNSVYETKSGSGSYLYSLNGITSETVPSISVSNITDVAAAGVSGATTTVTFTNNDGWSASVAGDDTIVTSASISGSTITYSVAANSGSARSGSITVTLTKSGRTDVSATINVGQLAGNGGSTPYYVKVTDLSTLSANDNIIIVNMNHNALPAFTGTGTISESSISSAYDSTNDRFSVTSSVTACSITLKAPTTAVNGKTVFKLLMSNSNYITKTGTSGTGFNPATTSTSVGGDWTLSMDSNGRVNVKNNYSGSTRCLIWRAGSTNKFGAYASSNVNDSEYYNVYIYKLAN
ncbi:MAG: chitobiase/beta-hexosaminidase C-terminal domain-containing protein [Bacteroidales bacterium]|nr:chitobiase/beta-hexosaminidase C-terminal domain-containing protein [Bacteroidales bacterium]